MSSNDHLSADDAGQFFGGIVAKVHGAQSDAVNGVYNMDGQFDGVGKYMRNGRWEDEDCVFCLFRSTSVNGTKHWNISIIPHDMHGVPGTNADISLYRANAKYVCPPMCGWYSSGETSYPPPQVKTEALFTDYIPVGFKPVAATYEGVLFSEQFSDVKIICSDGEAVPAHKCILAASSPYFKALFSGPWEETQSGQLKMNYDANIIKTVLSFLYTGEVNVKLIGAEPIAFLGAATQYGLEWLKVFAEHGCIQALHASTCNLREIWQAGRLYQSGFVKKACVEYAHLNASTVLARGDIQLLQTDDPASWKKFSSMMKEVIDQDSCITIEVVNASGDGLYFRLRLSQKLKGAFLEFSERKGLDLATLRFFLPDGSLIDGERTCDELRLRDDSRITYEVVEAAMDQD